MQLLFLNNFRGFSDTFVKINDINFLVGENSTGKTSLLKVLKCLKRPDFWLGDNFDLSSADLGYFDEITTAKGGKSSFFEIGVANLEKKSGFKFKYIDVKGYPVVSEMVFINEEINLEVVNINSAPKFRLNQYSLDEDFEAYFRRWVKKTDLGSIPFSSFTKEDNIFTKNQPFLFKVSAELSRSNVDLLEYISIDFNNYWFSPIRTNPKRIYDEPHSKRSPDGTHTPFILRDSLIDRIDKEEKKRKKSIEDILKRFGSDSGLFESVNIKEYENNATSPFQLQVVIGGKHLNFTNVGYGVSQILPLLTEIAISPSASSFSIQQPEVHLHPRGQASFADFIFKSYRLESKMFIIETHSDYLIDRFRILLNKSGIQKDKEESLSQILYFSRGVNGNEVQSIPIINDGRYATDLPEGYREFFIREQLDLLDI